MTPDADISVVIPCHNAAKWIAGTLQSVLAQQPPPREVIVVDDGSSDGSAELVGRQFPTVQVIRQANAGVAAARNRGLAVATSTWVAFIDADDLWLPGKLQAQLQLLQSQAGARMAYTAWHVWPSQAAVPELAWLHGQGGGDASRWQGASGWIYTDLLLDCVVWTSTVLARRDLFAEIGQFDETLRIGEDYDLWLRASRVTPILRVPQPLALYRMHPASITRRVPERNWQAMVVERALERWGYASPDGRSARKSDVSGALARCWRDFANAQLSGGNAVLARQAGWRAVRHSPADAGSWKVLARSLGPAPRQDGGAR